MKYKKIIMGLLLFMVFIGLINLVVFGDENTNKEFQFSDVKSSDWYYDSVVFSYEKSLMKGTDFVSFNPRVFSSRGMVVTTLYRLENEPIIEYACLFDDVSTDKWYYKAVTWDQIIK